MKDPKRNANKLSLRRRPLRKLESSDLEAVQGGAIVPQSLALENGMSLQRGTERNNHNQHMRAS